MTLRIHAPNPIRVGETANVLVTSDNPGVVSLTYGAGLTGPASVTIEGTRVWRNGLKHGQYLARANCLQARENITYFVKIRKSDLGLIRIPQVSSGMDTDWILQNVRSDLEGRVNWAIGLNYSHASTQTIRAIWGQSSTSGSNPVCSFAGSYFDVTSVDEIRLIFYAASMPSTAVDVYFSGGVTPDVTISRSALTSGTMGGTEAMVISLPGEYAILSGLASQAQREAFMSSGTLPSGLAASYQGGHEIVESAPVFWDTSGNDLDLSDVDVTYWPEAAASGDYTDTVPVVPYAIVPVTAVATTGTTIDATRPRQGVPSRASAAERIETATQVTVTVEAALTPVIGPDIAGTSLRFPALRRLTVFSQTDGAVTLASDNAKVQVPASVTVADGFAVFDVSIAGEVSGVTITATQGTTTATCDVDLAYASADVPEMAPNDTLQLFPEWLWTEPHTQGIAAVMDDRRAAFVSDLDHLLIYDFENQTSAILDLVADMFGVYGWNKAAGTTEKVAFLESSLKILRKSGTHYAVKEAIRLVCDAAKIEDITIIEGTGGDLFDGTYDFDGTILYDSHYSWARFDVEIETTDASYFTAEIQAVIVSMINHYKPASRWLESLIITEI